MIFNYLNYFWPDEFNRIIFCVSGYIVLLSSCAVLVNISIFDLLNYTPFFLLDYIINFRVFVSNYNCMRNLLGFLSQLLRGIADLRHHIQGVYETLIGG